MGSGLHKNTHTSIYAFTLPAPLLLLQIHLLQFPQPAAPWSEALTVVMCVTERLRQSSVPGRMCYPCNLNVFTCRGPCWGWLLWASISTCLCVFLHVCVHVHCCIQYVCVAAHGLWSKEKAVERQQAAGVQFGAVSCWMLYNKQKKGRFVRWCLLLLGCIYISEQYVFFSNVSLWVCHCVP